MAVLWPRFRNPGPQKIAAKRKSKGWTAGGNRLTRLTLGYTCEAWLYKETSIVWKDEPSRSGAINHVGDVNGESR